MIVIIINIKHPINNPQIIDISEEAIDLDASLFHNFIKSVILLCLIALLVKRYISNAKEKLKIENNNINNHPTILFTQIHILLAS